MRWWDYLDEPAQWVVRCVADGDLVINQPTDICPGCGDPVEVMGRYRAEAPPVLLTGTTTCRECGDDLLTQPGLVSRCKELHRPSRRVAS